MILKNRLFERIEPSRNAKSIFIFCEGIKREKQYFQYFQEIDSRISVIIHPLRHDDDNSPRGLLEIAKNGVLHNDEYKNPKYDFSQETDDEVWIVIDIDEDKRDSRKSQIEEVIGFCKENINWNIALSNPCFEVWLYYHKSKSKPIFDEEYPCSHWKNLVNELIPGGFDSRRHPFLINEAITNAKNNFAEEKGFPKYACTKVFELGESIYSLIKGKLQKALENL